MEAVGGDYLGCLNQFPDGVLAGGRQPGVVHEWISKTAGLAAAFPIVCARTAVSEQLQRTQFFLGWEGNFFGFGLNRWRQHQGKPQNQQRQSHANGSIDGGILTRVRPLRRFEKRSAGAAPIAWSESMFDFSQILQSLETFGGITCQYLKAILNAIKPAQTIGRE